MNTAWGEQGIINNKELHGEIATALENGLLEPVVQNSDRKGLMQFANEVADLVERARTEKLSPKRSKGTPLQSRTTAGSAACSLRQLSINRRSRSRRRRDQYRAVVIDKAIAIRPMGYLFLSFDHRAIDGVTADQSLVKVKGYLERSHWEQIL